ncbi:unnamed protein product [Nezara viridula]|uniref:fructose-bisphosphate aldolase n=1 Tax=Nezara viridula TaxID=85310 RepID=A0A9P0E574_NEZVI|nr:unnamed protein product [Nezara viridula]
MKRFPIFNSNQENPEVLENLVKHVNELMDTKKGVFAMDEHVLAFNFLFSLYNRDNDWENRRLLRQFLVTAPLEKQFSAILLSEEFMKQSDDEAIEFFDIVKSKHLLLGVRLDIGTSTMFGLEGEYVSTGVNNLVECFNFYKERGCLYSKFRSIYQIEDYCPTLCGTEKISYRLARFAALSQANGLVPIISVEVVPDGTEDIYKARIVLEKILINLIKALNDLEVFIEATILQVSFVQPGHMRRSCSISPDKIAEQTAEAFKRSLPISLGGLLFHSSGLSEENATQVLNRMILLKEANESMLPWKMNYSFGRAQKASAIMTWGGDPNFEEAGHRELMERAKANNEALLGKYVPKSVQGSFSDQKLYVPNYIS